MEEGREEGSEGDEEERRGISSMKQTNTLKCLRFLMTFYKKGTKKKNKSRKKFLLLILYGGALQ